MQKIYYFLIATLIAACLLNSCSVTRTETDLFTITDRDTVFSSVEKNEPGTRDKGVIYPSSREINSHRMTLQHDSSIEREYPNFIRLGVFEGVGLLFSGDGKNKLGNGLFGIFPDFNSLNNKFRGNSKYVFNGGLYRFGIGEGRLRWFRDAKNWTIGTSLIEFIAPDARLEKSLVSVLPIYVRKRFFLREEIPYIAFTPAFGIGLFPSQYINMSASLDVGSIGGLNARLYAGYAMGINTASSLLVRNSAYADGKAQSSEIPYIGLGFSFLDFLNLVPETKREWKDYEYSSWNVGLLQIGLISSGADTSAFTSTTNAAFSGLSLRLMNASVALPILDYKLYAGTSLASMLILGKNEWGLSIMPIRFGYWQPVIEDELTIEPFLEINYYPSSYLNFGGRLNLRLNDLLNLSLMLGYADGNSGTNVGKDLGNNLGVNKNFSRFYFGIGVGLADFILFPQDLRYNKFK